VVGTRFAELLHELLGEQQIEELAVPYAAVCGDLETGAEVVLTRGTLADAVRASSAIPGILTPVVSDGRTLVDGIVVTPVPTHVARSLAAAPLLAVNVIGTPSAVPLITEPSHDRPLVTQPSRLLQRFNRWLEHHSETPTDTPQLPDRFQVSMRSFHIMVAHLAARTAQSVDMVEPAVGHIGWFDFHRVSEAVTAGHEAYRRWRATRPLDP
jgi:NTE family protein